MEDDLKKNIKKYSIHLKYGRRPQKNKKWKTTSKKKGRRTKKNLFPIPLKFRGKPFFGLGQLSKIFCKNVIPQKLCPCTFYTLLLVTREHLYKLNL